MSHSKKIHEFLLETGQTLSLAESCTGGALATHFTSQADASKYFLGSLVTYSNGLKHKLLSVAKETLIEQGAVSRLCATEMLLGLFKVTESDFAVAVTGIAGPTGGSVDKPIGTVFIALAKRGAKPHVVECHFSGNRLEIIATTCDRALEELLTLLEGSS